MAAELVNAILRALPDAGGCMTTAELVARTGFSQAEVSATCGKLISRNLIERTQRGCFRLTSMGATARAAGLSVKVGRPKGSFDTGLRRPPATSLRARLWQALRQERKASIGELLAIARDGSESDGPRDAQRYMRALVDAGLVIRLSRPGADGEFRYFLAADPGPKAPFIRRARAQVVEPNSGRVIQLEAMS